MAPDDESHSALVRRDGTRGNGDRLNKKARHAAPGGSSGRTRYEDPPTTEAEDDDTGAEDDDTEAEDDDTVQPDRRNSVEGGRGSQPLPFE